MIAKKPKSKSSPKETKETKAQKFIRGGGKPTAPPPSNGPRQIKPVLIGFEVGLLARIDAAAEEMGITRTAYVVMAVAEKTRRLERI